MAFGRSKEADREPETPPRREPSAGRGIDSFIAAGMVLDGDCQTDGTLRVDGHVKGNVRANHLTIGAGGRVDGTVTGAGRSGSAGETVLIDGRVGGAVSAPRVEIGRQGSIGAGLKVKDAVIRGRVLGEIRAEDRVLLEDTAVVEGDVTALRLELKEGGQLTGTVRIGQTQGARPESAAVG